VGVISAVGVKGRVVEVVITSETQQHLLLNPMLVLIPVRRCAMEYHGRAGGAEKARTQYK
jgi:hypothetical protein